MTSRRHHGFRLALLLACVALPVGVAGQEPEREPSHASGGTLRVHIIGLRSDDGYIGCLLYRGGDGFPNDPDKSLQKAVGRYGVGNRRTATCTFTDVPRGTYAVAVGHDENGNRRMDTNMVGIPVEGWGTSNDARARFGPPQYSDARFDFDGRRKLIVVTMRYGF